MRCIEWRHLLGTFAESRSQVQKSKNSLYFCPVDLMITLLGFLSQRGCRKTPRPSLVDISTLTINQRIAVDPIKAKSKEFCSPRAVATGVVQGANAPPIILKVLFQYDKSHTID